MRPLTEHFRWDEVERSSTAIARGIANTVPASMELTVVATAQQMEAVRALFGKPIKVNSWYRSRALNEAIGGAKTSYHMQGLAVDFEVPGLPNARVFHVVALSDIPYDQLIHERTRSGADWIHIGFAPPGRAPRRQQLKASGDNLGGKMTFTRVEVG